MQKRRLKTYKLVVTSFLRSFMITPHHNSAKLCKVFTNHFLNSLLSSVFILQWSLSKSRLRNVSVIFTNLTIFPHEIRCYPWNLAAMFNRKFLCLSRGLRCLQSTQAILFIKQNSPSIYFKEANGTFITALTTLMSSMTQTELILLNEKRLWS